MAPIYSRLKAPITAPTAPGVARAGLHGGDAEAMAASFESLNLGGFWSTDRSGRVIYLSPALAARLLHHSAAADSEFVGLFMQPGITSDGQRTLPFALARQSRFERVIARTVFDQIEALWSVSGEPVLDDSGDFAGFRGHIVDVTRDRHSAEQASHLATTDALTGLMNRRRMGEVLARTLATQAPRAKPCAVLLIDLDRFAQVNDTLGHAVGDALLKHAALRLLNVVGQADRLCRLGGDEFQVIVPDCGDRVYLADLAARIIAKLSEPYALSAHRCTIGASVGIALCPDDGASADDLMRNADLALYAAKQSGRGSFRFFARAMHEAAEQRRQLEETMHDALLRGEFELHYQPLVELESNCVVGTEALVRWNHAQRGMIAPGLFIPIAEQSAMIGRIGEWVLGTACADAARWPGRVRVAVNVSPVQFADPHFPKVVAAALNSSGLDPDRLELEITESVFLQPGAATAAMFRALKSLGVRLVLDDFGTGYSSLSYLKDTPFDKIKIDQSFIRGVNGAGSRNRAIISAIVTLAAALDMDTIAEGVETLDHLAMVRELNIGQVQGYIFSKPVPERELFRDQPSDLWMLSPAGPAQQRHERRAMFRTIGVIHDDHYYPVTLRNLSLSGALIEGLLNVPVDTWFLVDLGEGQLELARVARSREASQGIRFECELVNDDEGGLGTRHRFSRDQLDAAGVPVNAMETLAKQAVALRTGQASLPRFRLAGRLNGSRAKPYSQPQGPMSHL